VAKLRTSWTILLAAAALLAGGLACNAVGGAGNGADPTATPRPARTPADEPTEEEEPTDEEPVDEATRTPRPSRTPEAEEEPTETPEPEAGGVLFEDDFSDPDSGWGEDEDETAVREYRDDEYVIEIFDTGWLIWNTAGQDGLSNTHTVVTITNVGEAQDPAFGVICNYQDADGFYYLGAGPDGYFGIVRSEGDDDFFLTSDADQWEFSEDVEQFADEYVLEAICAADGTLTLVVNGTEIASVQDTTYTEGDVGVFVVSFEETPVEIHFDDLIVFDAE
jgi:hypothetical protein